MRIPGEKKVPGGWILTEEGASERERSYREFVRRGRAEKLAKVCRTLTYGLSAAGVAALLLNGDASMIRNAVHDSLPLFLTAEMWLFIALVAAADFFLIRRPRLSGSTLFLLGLPSRILAGAGLAAAILQLSVAAQQSLLQFIANHYLLILGTSLATFGGLMLTTSIPGLGSVLVAESASFANFLEGLFVMLALRFSLESTVPGLLPKTAYYAGLALLTSKSISFIASRVFYWLFSKAMKLADESALQALHAEASICNAVFGAIFLTLYAQL